MLITYSGAAAGRSPPPDIMIIISPIHWCSKALRDKLHVRGCLSFRFATRTTTNKYKSMHTTSMVMLTHVCTHPSAFPLDMCDFGENITAGVCARVCACVSVADDEREKREHQHQRQQQQKKRRRTSCQKKKNIAGGLPFLSVARTHACLGGCEGCSKCNHICVLGQPVCDCSMGIYVGCYAGLACIFCLCTRNLIMYMDKMSSTNTHFIWIICMLLSREGRNFLESQNNQ